MLLFFEVLGLWFGWALAILAPIAIVTASWNIVKSYKILITDDSFDDNKHDCLTLLYLNIFAVVFVVLCKLVNVSWLQSYIKNWNFITYIISLILIGYAYYKYKTNSELSIVTYIAEEPVIEVENPVAVQEVSEEDCAEDEGISLEVTDACEEPIILIIDKDLKKDIYSLMGE